ncbi:MAG: hypothetical protein U1F42_01160 [Candidatus Competibacteraceae bacterium]
MPWRTTEEQQTIATRKLALKGAWLFRERYPTICAPWSLRDRIHTSRQGRMSPGFPACSSRRRAGNGRIVADGPFLCEAFALIWAGFVGLVGGRSCASSDWR